MKANLCAWFKAWGHQAVRVVLSCLLVFSGPSGFSAGKGFDCLVEPNQVVEIRSPVEGIIERIHVQRGDAVRKGQVLVDLESDVERTAMESARFRAQMSGRIESATGRLEYASRKARRTSELHAENFLAAQQRDDAEIERRLAEAELKDALEGRDLARIEHRHAEGLLKLRSLRSPFDGVVMDRMLNPGDLAEAGTGRKPILKIAQVHPLRVEAVLPQAEFGRLRVGMSAEVVAELAERKLLASVKVVDRVLDAASGTFGVRMELPNPSGALPSGVRCQVHFPQANFTDRGPAPRDR